MAVLRLITGSSRVPPGPTCPSGMRRVRLRTALIGRQPLVWAAPTQGEATPSTRSGGTGWRESEDRSGLSPSTETRSPSARTRHRADRASRPQITATPNDPSPATPDEFVEGTPLIGRRPSGEQTTTLRSHVSPPSASDCRYWWRGRPKPEARHVLAPCVSSSHSPSKARQHG